MRLLKNISYILVLIFLSCNEQSNPYVVGSEGSEGYSDAYIYNLYMDGPARDFIVLENVNIENFENIDGNPIFRSCEDSGMIDWDSNYSDYSNYVNCDNLACSINDEDTCASLTYCYWSDNNTTEDFTDDSCINNEDVCLIATPDCDNRYWCKLEGESCVSDTKDLLIVANEDEDNGLLIYEIIEDPELKYLLIYHNNEIEFNADEENVLDTELRSLHYSENTYMLYALDKFEFIYSIFLPGLLDNLVLPELNISSHEKSTDCPALINEEDNFESIHELQPGLNSDNYHATQFQVYEEEIGDDWFPGMFILHKYNSSTNSDQPKHSQLHYSVNSEGSSPLSEACVGSGAPTSISGVEVFNDLDVVDVAGLCNDINNQELCDSHESCEWNIDVCELEYEILTESDCANIPETVWLGESGYENGILTYDDCMEYSSEEFQASWDGDLSDDYGQITEQECSAFESSIWSGSNAYDYGIITQCECNAKENSIWYDYNCSNPVFEDEVACLDEGYLWTNMECLEDACNLPINAIYLDGSDVLYNTDTDIGGFQFNVNGGATVSGGSGGDAQTAGFVVQGAGTTVLGFSFTGGFVPAGCGTLTSLTLTGNAIGLSDIIFSDSQPSPEEIDVTYDPGIQIAGCGDDEDAGCGINDVAGCWYDELAPCQQFSMNYDVTDFIFKDNFLHIANPADDIFSLVSYDYSNFNHIIPQELLADVSPIINVTPEKIRELYTKNDHIYLGLENIGCYITTQNDIINSAQEGNIFDGVEGINFYAIADGFTVYNVQYDDSKLLLSCGSDGVLIYDWNEGNISPTLIAHVTSSFAYKAKVYDESRLMISTKNGIEVYYIGG